MSEHRIPQPMTMIVPTREHIVKLHSDGAILSFEEINSIVESVKKNGVLLLANWTVDYIPRGTRSKKRIRLHQVERGRA